MERILELFDAAERAFSSDEFVAGVRENLRTEPLARKQYLTYEAALQRLDADSWAAVKAKALAHFRDHRRGQLKQGFFNQLNDAFAYGYLLDAGASHVRVLPETLGKNAPKQADIRFCVSSGDFHCEVKTIGISDAEIARQASQRAFSSHIYRALDQSFLRKLAATIEAASAQVAAHGTPGLVFLLVRFDDFTGDYHSTYREQIRTALNDCAANTVCVTWLPDMTWLVEKNCDWIRGSLPR